MSEQKHFIKQVWRQKTDALFDRIPFKEENKAREFSQTTRPVLLIETKSNGGSNAVFAIGHVTEAKVIEEAVTFPNQSGEYLYHVPFAYDLVLADKQAGITREELQELAGQKFAPQVKGGLYEIEADVFEKVAALLKERMKSQSTAVTPQAEDMQAEQPIKANPSAKAPADQGNAINTAIADQLAEAREKLIQHPALRLLMEEGKVNYYPASLLRAADDLVELQEILNEYVQNGGQASVEAATEEAASTAEVQSGPLYANVIGLVERLVREGRYDSVQIPTLEKAFYREEKLPHPYLAIELKGRQGHHVLGVDGTLYTTEGKVVQHYLGL
jgi:hypothetical protein